MAQLKKIENTMADHPELEELLKSVDLSGWFDDEEKDKDDDDSKKDTKNKK